MRPDSAGEGKRLRGGSGWRATRSLPSRRGGPPRPAVPAPPRVGSRRGKPSNNLCAAVPSRGVRPSQPQVGCCLRPAHAAVPSHGPRHPSRLLWRLRLQVQVSSAQEEVRR